MHDTTTASEPDDEQSARIVADMNARMDEIKAKSKAAFLLQLQGWKADADSRQQEEEEAAAASAKAAVAKVAVVNTASQQPHEDHMSIDETSPMSRSEEEEDGEVMEDVLSTWQPRKLKTVVPSNEASRYPSISVASAMKRPSLDDSTRAENTKKKSKQTLQPPPKEAHALSGGLAGLKISKKPGTSLKKTDRASPEATTTIAERPPAWYKKLKPTATRNPDEANAQVLLDRLKSDVKKAKSQTSKGNMQQTSRLCEKSYTNLLS